MIARRSRGTPRIVNRLLRRARDYAQVRAAGRIDVEVAAAALDVLGIDSIGLDELDRRVLGVLCGTLGGHPVGVQTIAVSVQEDPDTIEDIVEPFLIRRGLLARTLRGRLATAAAYQHLGLAVPAGAPGAAEAQTALFER
jgi:Holliday junction DNA helicase RuvB